MRPFLAGVLGAGIFFAPWWVPFGIGMLMLLRFQAWEAVGAAVVLDVLYGTPHSWSGYVLSVVMLLALMVLEPFRRRLAR